MAQLLYKLGLFSAKRAWLVILSWLILLGTAISLMVGFSGKLSSSMTIDGIPAQAVIDRLQESFPEAARGQGQAVFHKTDSGFTEAERALISAALEDAKSIPGVANVIDPFATAQEIADQQAELRDGETKLAEAREQIATGQTELEDGRAELDAAQAELYRQRAELTTTKTELEGNLTEISAGLAQLQASGAPESMQQPLIQNQQAVTQGLQQVTAGEAQLAQAKPRLTPEERSSRQQPKRLPRGLRRLKRISSYLQLENGWLQSPRTLARYPATA